MRKAHVLLRANQLFCASFSSRTAIGVTHTPVSVSAAPNLGTPSVDCVGWRGVAGWARGGAAAFSGRHSLPDSSAGLDVRWQSAGQHLQRGNQRRDLFGITKNDDLSKQYRERRLVGCVAFDSAHLMLAAKRLCAQHLLGTTYSLQPPSA